MRSVLFLLLTLCAIPVFGQGKTLLATRSKYSIKVDGKLEEASWAGAPVAGGFAQYFPTPGTPASTPTEVKVLYDDDAVYVGDSGAEPSCRSAAVPR